MAVSAHVAVEPEDFRLGRTLTAEPGLRVEFEGTVPLCAGSDPYLWVASADTEWVRDAVGDEDSIDGVTVVTEQDDEVLLQVEWTPDGVELFDAFAATGATCLKAVGTDGTWHLTLRFPDRESLAACYERCSERDVSVTVKSVHDVGLLENDGGASNLTDPQREALRTALDGGYFAVPRQMTLQELAGALEISDTAASQRLRRGLEKLLVESALL